MINQPLHLLSKDNQAKVAQAQERRQDAMDELALTGWVSLLKLAYILGISYPTICRYRDRGLVRCTRMGGTFRVMEDEVDRLLRYGTHASERAPSRAADAAVEAVDEAHLTKTHKGPKRQASLPAQDTKPTQAQAPIVLEPVPMEDITELDTPGLDENQDFHAIVPKLPGGR